MKKHVSPPEFVIAATASQVHADCPSCEGVAIVYTDGKVFCIDCGTFEPEPADGVLYRMHVLASGHAHVSGVCVTSEMLAAGVMSPGPSTFEQALGSQGNPAES